MNGRPLQLTLPLDCRPAMGREDFLVAPSNRIAVDMIDSWPQWGGHSVILGGPAGSGKSHLAEVWRSRSGAVRLKAGEISGDMLSERAGHAVVVEDAPGPTLDERALFHLYNHLKELGGHILITTRVPPSRWPLKLADLATRVRASPYIELQLPDDTLLAGLILKLFRDRQIDIDDGTIRFMMARMERSFAAARELVEAVDRRALRDRLPVTRRLVSRVLHDSAGPTDYTEDEA